LRESVRLGFLSGGERTIMQQVCDDRLSLTNFPAFHQSTFQDPILLNLPSRIRVCSNLLAPGHVDASLQL
jgi:hypothetical protein